MNLNNRQQLLTVVALAVVAFWLSDKLIFTPLTNSWRDRSVRIDRLRKSVDGGTQLLKRETSIRGRWAGMRTNTLPTEVSAAESAVLRSFDRWSDASRVSITSIKPQWKHDADDYTTDDDAAIATHATNGADEECDETSIAELAVEAPPPSAPPKRAPPKRAPKSGAAKKPW